MECRLTVRQTGGLPQPGTDQSGWNVSRAWQGSLGRAKLERIKWLQNERAGLRRRRRPESPSVGRSYESRTGTRGTPPGMVRGKCCGLWAHVGSWEAPLPSQGALPAPLKASSWRLLYNHPSQEVLPHPKLVPGDCFIIRPGERTRPAPHPRLSPKGRGGEERTKRGGRRGV